MVTDPIERLCIEFANVPEAIKILKVQEEAGEVAEAYIGALGVNPRKGNTHTMGDVAGELIDVALTALVAYCAIGGGDWPYALNLRARHALDRLANAREEGVR